MDNGEDVTWTGLAEAATRLGTSPAAIRKRIKRGSMEAAAATTVRSVSC
jgi:hypothetical protein